MAVAGAAGLTQAEAARRMGIDPSALKRVEAGTELPPDPRAMARVYVLTAADLAAVVRRSGAEASYAVDQP